MGHVLLMNCSQNTCYICENRAFFVYIYYVDVTWFIYFPILLLKQELSALYR